MPGRDPSHWLYRLDGAEWLRAADAELGRARVALLRKEQRAGVAGARRAAGMAWNAVLCEEGLDEAYGRSYMEHLQRLSADAGLAEPVRAAARALLEAPLVNELVTLGPGDTRLHDAACLIVAEARRRLGA